jgi:hypothetical protein
MCPERSDRRRERQAARRRRARERHRNLAGSTVSVRCVCGRRSETNRNRRARSTPPAHRIPLRRDPDAGHFGMRTIRVDQAGFGRVAKAGDRAPQFQERGRDRRPGHAGLRTRGLVAIAAFVGDPAKRPAIRHAHAERPPRLRHARREERRRLQNLAHGRLQFHLAVAVKVARIEAEAGQDAGQV